MRRPFTAELLFLFISATTLNADIQTNEVDECPLNPKLENEILSHRGVAEVIINSVVNGPLKGSMYNFLAEFVDKFGNRIAGSQNLENAIDYMLQKSRNYSLENVHAEKVQVPHWVRGAESATLIKPRKQNLSMLGLGSSIGTSPEGIQAEAIVVKSFEELKGIPNSKIKGKIVVYNQKYVNYGVSVLYRDYGATRAAEKGAVASLIRSITPFSMNNPHTGWQDYESNVTQIPTACITVEDANMLERMQKRGTKIVIEMKMEAKNLPPATSRNTVAEIKGKKLPQKVVVISGHLDSWDVGQGAMDDGGGAFLAWSSLVLLKQLNLRPRRTIRTILWTAEEEGLVGASAYVKAHKNEEENLDFVMESDMGTFTPLGLTISSPKGSEADCIIRKILSLMVSINATMVVDSTKEGPDISTWLQEGIPGASLLNKNDKYFWFHHSRADTMDVENPDDLDKATALWAAVAYIIADLSVDIPRS